MPFQKVNKTDMQTKRQKDKDIRHYEMFFSVKTNAVQNVLQI